MLSVSQFPKGFSNHNGVLQIYAIHTDNQIYLKREIQ